VYTGLADDELYFVIAGSQLDAVVEKLITIVDANRELEKFHRGRVSQLKIVKGVVKRENRVFP
jgi:hypothetical protein